MCWDSGLHEGSHLVDISVPCQLHISEFTGM